MITYLLAFTPYSTQIQPEPISTKNYALPLGQKGSQLTFMANMANM